MRIVKPIEPADIATAEEILNEYIDTLGLSRCGLAEFADDLATFPIPYVHPTGCFLLALEEDSAAGCVAIKESGESVCELKRLFVKPSMRGRRIARKLVLEIIAEAVVLDYHRIRLDTEPGMVEAISLYQSLGFRPIPAFRTAPQEHALFFELELR